MFSRENIKLVASLCFYQLIERMNFNCSQFQSI